MLILTVHRFFSCILAFWYLLVSSGTLYAALENPVPLTKTVERADFPCAYHDCGCKTIEQYQTQCCCARRNSDVSVSEAKSHNPETASQVVKVSYLSAFQCSTRSPQAASSGGSKPGPHLPVMATFVKSSDVPQIYRVDRGDRPHNFSPEPEDKIPI